MANTSTTAMEGCKEREHRQAWLEHYDILQAKGFPLGGHRTHSDFCDTCGMKEQDVTDVLKKVRKISKEKGFMQKSNLGSVVSYE